MNDRVLDDLGAAYDRNGYVLVPQLLSTSVLADLERWIDDIVRMAGQANTSSELYCYYEDDGRQLRQIENGCAMHPALVAFAEGESMRRVVSRLMGQTARLFKDKINFKLPGGAGYAPHRDGRFWWTDDRGTPMRGWDVYASAFISVVIGIDSSTRENGCLEIAPGRHRLDAGEEYGPLTEAEAAAMTFEPCPTEPGDVLFFDALAPHRSGPNLSDAPRRVIYFTYHPEADGNQRARYFQDKQRSLARGATNR
jgi:ectoine hydroxylase-related dioxygenase (phytanoyl-CoA dioxygenase family)